MIEAMVVLFILSFCLVPLGLLYNKQSKQYLELKLDHRDRADRLEKYEQEMESVLGRIAELEVSVQATAEWEKKFKDSEQQESLFEKVRL